MNETMTSQDRLYGLLPAVYRERDAERGYPLRALLGLVNPQADELQGDIQQLWDNFFVETCERWAIPYIGDLVGNRLLHDIRRLQTVDEAAEIFTDLIGPDLRPEIAIRLRADVAKTIYYRRRKGTLPMLEELSRDVTGWAAHAVEFFERLVWSHNLNHLRLFSTGTPDIRSVEALGRLNGAFDPFSHTVDVRAIAQMEGWYNIRNIGFFLWRLGSYPLTNVPARQASQPWQYHFSPLGNAAPLFSRWRREGNEAGLATELHVPGPIRPAFFYEDLVDYQNQQPLRPDFTNLYGLLEPYPGSLLHPNPEASLALVRNGVPVSLALDPNAPLSTYQPQIVCRQLNPWPAAQPPGQVIAVDVKSGRIAVGSGWPNATQSIDVFYHYGFSADLGGGPYERRNWLVRPELAVLNFRVEESPSPERTHASVTAALTDWVNAGRPDAIISILDSRNYTLPASISLDNGHWLVIQAANQERPLLQTANTGLEVHTLNPADPDHPSELTLSGVLVEGFIHVTGDLGRLRLLHSTIVPGRSLNEDGSAVSGDPSLIVDAGPNNTPINSHLKVQLAFSISGALRVPEHSQELRIMDSIVDGLPAAPGAGIAIAADSTGAPTCPATIERTTVFGETFFKELLLASEVIFTGLVTTIQRQQGCVRFSFVPDMSSTPRRYRCQPDLQISRQTDAAIKQAEASGPPLTQAQKDAMENATRQSVVLWLLPTFTAERYGLPEYAQLRLGCPVHIRTGAEDESEMGAFCHLKQPQRETNLKIRLDEYLPFGLEAEIIYVT